MKHCLQNRDRLKWEHHLSRMSILRIKESSQNESLKRAAETCLSRKSYACEISSEFIFGRRPAELNLKREIIVRDGPGDLIRFFNGMSPQLVRPQLVVSAELKDLVPSTWRKQVDFYKYYCLTQKRSELPIFVFGPRDELSPYTEKRLRSLEQRGDIVLFLYRECEKKRVPALQKGQPIAQLSLSSCVADSYITHKLLSEGASMLISEKRESVHERKRVGISPYHGFSIFRNY